VLRLHRIPFSTNVARVEIVLGLKGVEFEHVDHDPADRSALRALSGQDLVPVVEADGEVLFDSPAIMRWAERRWPEPPLWPAEPAARAEMDTFIDWFNLVWKSAPNGIDAELGKADPDRDLVARLGEELRESVERFDALLDGRDFLLGDTLSAADVTAWPFLAYARGCPPGDEERFHRILADHLAPAPARLLAWVERVHASVPATYIG
jgi:glutathione S-transferase